MPEGYGTVTKVQEDRVYVRPDTASAQTEGVDMDADELHHAGATLPNH
jgi:hypothetical protein